MAEKVEVKTFESAFQLHLPSVVINVCHDVNIYLRKRMVEEEWCYTRTTINGAICCVYTVLCAAKQTQIIACVVREDKD